jgi:aspartyl-tRNA(Asn)/glutamyl-tRNA(Gln) amidotransferase subunit B
MSEFEIVIGLEVHVQLNTNSKVFCWCSTEFESPPNTNICPICCGYPGVLPVLNKKALELAVRVALCLNCKINKKIYFERKNYFYPDLPKNYQISQYKLPLGEDGFLEIPSGKKIRIKRVHLEEDAGKLIHRSDCSLVDFNRAGIPLLEIVSYPDINTPQEAFEYLNYLKLTLRYIKASECDMEKGSLRCDANISLRKKGETTLGTKVELKNMNTFKGVKDALEYEARRQLNILKKGQKVIQETRLWSAQESKTMVMRTKEEAHDYRYFPEPDLLDFYISEEIINQEKEYIGELPLQKKRRFINEYNLSEKEIGVLLSDKWLADFFENSCKFFNEPKKISNWLLGPFLEQINLLPGRFEDVKITPQNFSKIVKYFCEGKLNNLTAKKVLSLSINTEKDIDEIIKNEGLLQVSGKDELVKFIKEVIRENTKAVEEYLEGKKQAIQFLIGQVMRKTKGKANPKITRELLEQCLMEVKNKENVEKEG